MPQKRKETVTGGVPDGTQSSANEWTHHTFHPWIGCTQLSPAYDHCYAMVMVDHRYHRVKLGAGEIRIRTTKEYWRQPIRWNRLAAQEGVRERVFCESLADVFDGESPEDLGPWKDELWGLIESTPQLDWLLYLRSGRDCSSFCPME